MEQLDLTVPEVPPSRTSYKVTMVYLNFAEASVTVFLTASDGTVRTYVYGATTTPTGATLLAQLNKANLTTLSLQKRILQQLTTSGFLAGAVTGSPD